MTTTTINDNNKGNGEKKDEGLTAVGREVW